MASKEGVLRGRISTEPKVLSGTVHSGEKDFSGTIPGTLEFHYSDAAPVYDGPYEVTPGVDGQTLETARKRMEKDVTIKAIPYFEVSNTAGGSTVYIAKELD